MTEELKPCPFCGTIPAKDSMNNVWCNNDKCPIVGDIFSGGVRHWNTRAPVAEQAEPVGYVSRDSLKNLTDTEWQRLRGPSENIWTINKPPSRAIFPLYTAPPAPRMLTDEEVLKIAGNVTPKGPTSDAINFARAILTAAGAVPVAQMPEDQEENLALIDRLANLLAGVCVAIKGPELPRHRHSYHDIVEVAEKTMLELEIYKQTSCVEDQKRWNYLIANLEDLRGTAEINIGKFAVIARLDKYRLQEFGDSDEFKRAIDKAIKGVAHE